MIAGILIGIVSGLLANEFCEFGPWCARRLVRWSASRRYADPGRAEIRAEELAALIDDRPGNLFKLITAIGFAGSAVIASTCRAMARESDAGTDRDLADRLPRALRSTPIKYGTLARFSDIWAAWRDGRANVARVPTTGAPPETADAGITPYIAMRDRHFLDLADLERLRMESDLAETYRMRAEIREKIAGANEKAAIQKELESMQAVDTADSLRAQEARLSEMIAAREMLLNSQIRQLFQYSLRRCGSYMYHIVRNHPDGSAVIPYLKLALPELPDWLPGPGTEQTSVAAAGRRDGDTPRPGTRP